METKEIDYFMYPEQLPLEVQQVLDEYSEGWDESYAWCEALLKALEPLGYTFDYYLDACPYNLRLKTD